MENGIGMGLATTFVLLCSNILVSALRNIIPPKVRIACFIIIIATFVIVVELMMQAYAYPLFLKLGLFIPLIVVNCIVLGRAEAFASKNGLLPSIADGLGIGIGFTLSLAALGGVREVLGTGTFYGASVFGPSFQPFSFMVQAPGAFVCLGLMLCIMNLFE
jgi:electron transport complex protein RnfE